MMRILSFLLALLLTAGLIYILDSRKVLPAPLGKLLSPQEGLWQNAEPVNINFNDELRFPDLKSKVNVYLDERLVPHILPTRIMMPILFRGTCMQSSGYGKWSFRPMPPQAESVR